MIRQASTLRVPETRIWYPGYSTSFHKCRFPKSTDFVTYIRRTSLQDARMHDGYLRGSLIGEMVAVRIEYSMGIRIKERLSRLMRQSLYSCICIYPKPSGLGFFDSVFEAMSVFKRLSDTLLTLPYFRPARLLKMSTGHFLDAPPCLDLTPNKFVLILPNHSASSIVTQSLSEC